MSEIKQINLEETVSRDDYIECVKLLEACLNGEMKERNAWCGERHRYFSAVIPEYSFIRHGVADENLHFDKVPEDSDYAQLLKDIRGRILWYVNDGMISLGDVNDIFRASGLPVYGNKIKGTRLRVHLPYLDFNVRAEDEVEAVAWTRENFVNFLVRMLDGKPAEEGDKYVISSAVFIGILTEVRPLTQVDVVHQDTIMPSGRN